MIPEGRGPWPLVVFLHGAGERGSDNISQLRYLPESMATGTHPDWPHCVILAPQCPALSSWREHMAAIESIVGQWRADPRIDCRRVYLTGLSMGGFGAWELSARQPQWFSAVVPICGGGDVGTVERLIHVPIWAVHGSEDHIVPVDASRRLVEAIREAGGNVRYTELEGVGHDSWLPIYRGELDVLAWMFRQIGDQATDCGQRSSSSAHNSTENLRRGLAFVVG